MNSVRASDPDGRVRYSLGSRIVVAERSASVMIQEMRDATEWRFLKPRLFESDAAADGQRC